MFFVINLGLNAPSIGQLSGTVTDASKEPLIGATLSYDGGGLTTDTDGKFNLNLVEGSHNISITYVGMERIDTMINMIGSFHEVSFILRPSSNVLETATVTSGRYSQSISESSVSIEVIKPDLIKSININSLDEILEKVPGLNMIDGQANIRGGSGFSYGAGSRVLLLVDDVPALQADAGFPNWSDMPFELIDQVEVLKGAVSALYGANAMNGIVNVKTKWPGEKPETVIQLQRTQYLKPRNSAQQWWKGMNDAFLNNGYITHTRRIGALDVVLAGYFTDHRSFRKTVERYDRRLTAKLRYRINNRNVVSLSGSFLTGRSDNYFYWMDAGDNAYLPFPGVSNTASRKRYFIDGTYSAYTKSGNRHKILSRYYDVNNRNNEGRSVNSKLIFGEYQYFHKFQNGFQVTTGTALTHTKVKADLYGGFNFTSLTSAAYLQLDKKIFNNLNLNIGSRYEYNEINTPLVVAGDSITNGKISQAKPIFKFGLNYNPIESTFIRASVGQGFRYPTIAEMFIETNLDILPITPNPHLMSEFGFTAEIGIKQGFKISDFTGFIDFCIFHMQFENMMEFVFTGFVDGFQSQNIGNTINNGIELSIGGQGNIGKTKIGIIGGYTFIDPKYDNFTSEDSIRSSFPENVLKYRSRHMAKLDLQLERGKWGMGISNNYLSHMLAIDRIFEFIIPGVQDFRNENNKGHIVTDLRISYKILEKWQLSLYMNNIFNIAYVTRPGLLEAPRNVSLKSLFEF